jgi:hypothetical protein
VNMPSLATLRLESRYRRRTTLGRCERMRNPGPDSKTETLLDERDDLLVQISLEADSPRPNADKLFGMQRRLTRVENDIASRRQAMF